MENLISWVLKRINNRDKSLLLDAVKRTQQTHSAAKVTKKIACVKHTQHTQMMLQRTQILAPFRRGTSSVYVLKKKNRCHEWTTRVVRLTIK